MRKLAVFAVGVGLVMAVGGFAKDLCGLASRVAPLSCVTQQDFFLALNQVLGGCAGGAQATAEQVVAALIAKGYLAKDFKFSPSACVTKGLVSQVVYRTFGLRPDVIAWITIVITGLQPGLATTIAQRHCVMVLGESGDVITGREMVALLLAWSEYLIKNSLVPCTPPVGHTTFLRTWSVCIQRTVMSWVEAQVYIPCLVEVPTS